MVAAVTILSPAGLRAGSGGSKTQTFETKCEEEPQEKLVVVASVEESPFHTSRA